MTGQRHGAGARIGAGGQQFRGDDGSADPAVTAAMGAFWTGQGSEHAALVALSRCRLLVPVVALLGEAGESGADKDSEMALPKLIGHDGRPAIIAFTGLAALSRWRPDARPVPAEAIRVWQAAVAEDCAVVIDVAGPVPLEVEGARLAALAAGQPPPLPHQDPDIAAAVGAALAGLAAITGFRLEPGSVGLGSDLTVRLTVVGSANDPSLAAGPHAGGRDGSGQHGGEPDGGEPDGGDSDGSRPEGGGGGQDEVSEAAERVAQRLAGRVRAVEITTE